MQRRTGGQHKQGCCITSHELGGSAAEGSHIRRHNKMRRWIQCSKLSHPAEGRPCPLLIKTRAHTHREWAQSTEGKRARQ